MSGSSGVITSLQIGPGRGLPMRPVDPAVFTADLGLVGCRHAKSKSRRQVLLIEEETLAVLGLEPALIKENVTTRGIDLTSLPADTRLHLGEEVELWVSGPGQPCGLMNEIRPGLEGELEGRRGVFAWVKTGGRVTVGDRIAAFPTAGTVCGDTLSAG
ncbi:MAG: MOSC domain-containing protein [Gemmatimonadota bacterium]|nr:MAG: MOSC domain-containing protein [Gemmatimonadota bacterium]